MESIRVEPAEFTCPQCGAAVARAVPWGTGRNCFSALYLALMHASGAGHGVVVLGKAFYAKCAERAHSTSLGALPGVPLPKARSK